ncbi:MAG: hemolysin family protein [Bacteroidota bacterium]
MDTSIIIIITLICSAFFSGMEIAFITSNKLKIELDRKNGLLSGKILVLFNNAPSDFVSTMLLGNSIALVIYGMAMALMLDSFLLRHIPSLEEGSFILLTLQTIISTLIILVVAEFLPKALFRINPNRVLKFFSVPVFLVYYLLFPVQYVFVNLAELLLKYVFRVRFANEKYAFTRIDLDHYIKDYTRDEEEAEDLAIEIQMIQNTMEFRNVKVRECMVPRNEIAAVEDTDSMAELSEKFITTGHSKILVYRENIDTIIGYVHSYDMFSRPENIRAVVKNILIIPETMLAHDLLRRFIQEHKSVAVVVDEFGGTSGIITTEDLIEEIIGEIEDEFDTGHLIEKKINEKEFVLSARHEIDYLNDKYKFALPESDDYETLAGMILHYHESIPAKSEKIRIGELEITILQASNTRIELIKLHLA